MVRIVAFLLILVVSSCRNAGDQANGDLKGAAADYDEAIRINQRLAEAYVNRGVVRQAKGDLEGAVADWDEAIRINPRYAEAYVNRGIARQARGDRGGARADYENALEVAPPGWPHRAAVEKWLEALEDR